MNVHHVEASHITPKPGHEAGSDVIEVEPLTSIEPRGTVGTVWPRINREPTARSVVISGRSCDFSPSFRNRSLHDCDHTAGTPSDTRDGGDNVKNVQGSGPIIQERRLTHATKL